MPYVEQEVRRSRTFVPPEAQAIAARWRAIATELRTTASSLRALLSTLEGSWEGNAEQRFMAECGQLPGNLDNCAGLLELVASRAQSMTVTEWYTAVERVWVAEPIN